MKALFIGIVILAAHALYAQPDRFGAEFGATMDLRKLPSFYTRLSYSVPIRLLRLDAGALALFGRDGGFGFDVLVTRPVGSLEPLAGARFLVWDRSMSIGFPLGIRWKFVETAAIELTVGLSVAPTLHLAAEEQNTGIFDTFIGVRF